MLSSQAKLAEKIRKRTNRLTKPTDEVGLSSQAKLAEKIRKRTNRLTNLQTEAERIRAKQSKLEEMTAGQASVLARNEQEMDRITEEVGGPDRQTDGRTLLGSPDVWPGRDGGEARLRCLSDCLSTYQVEDLEEVLRESIADSISGRRAAAAKAAAGVEKSAKKRRRRDSDDDEDQGEDPVIGCQIRTKCPVIHAK
jgi:hypothetical protein